MATLRTTQAFESRSVADAPRFATRRDGGCQPQAAPRDTAGTVSFNWQLEADGVQDAIERIYR
ncbi:MAG: hypothetical protein JO023_08615 [Chloroflexi bacterium]|nr:hypothetical protein [Chloroflexota bacterium]